MPINCGYCGRTHPTAKEVKDCQEDHGRPKSHRSGRREGGLRGESLLLPRSQRGRLLLVPQSKRGTIDLMPRSQRGRLLLVP